MEFLIGLGIGIIPGFVIGSFVTMIRLRKLGLMKTLEED